MIENVSLFHNELVAAGLSINGCDSSGNVHLLSRPTAPLIDGEPDPNWFDPTDSIIEAVKNAHGKASTSDECAALHALLSEEQWLACLEAKKAPVRDLRASRYTREADPIYLKAIEDGLINNTTPDLSGWLAIKAQIRADLPYEE